VTDTLLVFNAGSSSLRCALYASATLEELCRVHVEAVDTARQTTSWSGSLAERLRPLHPQVADHAALTGWMLEAFRMHLPQAQIGAVGHRVVHGGMRFERPALIDASVIAEIERLVPLAPQHQPQSLAAIEAIATAWPHVPQIACFDTAFHRHAPRLAQLFALPRELGDAGILRYGFHGLSYEYLASKLRDLIGTRADGRVILAHLGHGASLCALHHGCSVATSMGFSALDGLMMGTRCGAIDPGVLLHLQQAEGYSVDKLADLLYRRSGLLGVSGLSDDLRVLEASRDPHAREAMELFAYRVVREIGSVAAALGGLDALVFSAGIGERSAAMRQRICSGLGWLGVALDGTANAAHATQISNESAAVQVFVIPTNEELTIARATQTLMPA
jgi:acetate kinase